jgi:hypothetical protein
MSLRKIIGIPTIIGVLIGTVKELSHGNFRDAGILSFVFTFLLFWVADVLKDVGKEGVDKVERRANRLLKGLATSRRPMPNSVSTEQAGKAFAGYLKSKFSSRSFRISTHSEGKASQWTISVRRSPFARLHITLVELSNDSNAEGDLRLAIWRGSPVFNGYLILLLIGVACLLGLQIFSTTAFGAEIDTVLFAWAVFGAVTIPLFYLLTWITAHTWFPVSVMSSIKADFATLTGLPPVQGDAMGDVPSTPEVPYMELQARAEVLGSDHRENLRGPREFTGWLSSAVPFLFAAEVVLVISIPGPPPKERTLEDGQQAFYDQHYATSQEILAPIAEKGDVRAQYLSLCYCWSY